MAASPAEPSPKQASSARVRQPEVSVSPIIASSCARITRFCGSGAADCAKPMPGARDVLPAVEQQRVRRIAVASRAADLLVVRLRAVRHVEMHDEAHVGPVDPHAEGDRRHHDHRLAGAEARQRRPLGRGLQSGVERDAGTPFSASLSAIRSVFARLPQ